MDSCEGYVIATTPVELDMEPNSQTFCSCSLKFLLPKPASLKFTLCSITFQSSGFGFLGVVYRELKSREEDVRMVVGYVLTLELLQPMEHCSGYYRGWAGLCLRRSIITAEFKVKHLKPLTMWMKPEGRPSDYGRMSRGGYAFGYMKQLPGASH